MIEFAEAAISLAGLLAWQRPVEFTLPCRAVVLDANGVRAIDPSAWDRLAADALECNPWLSRQMVLAGLDALEAETGYHALALYNTGSEELIGFLPFRKRGVGPFALARPALNLYQVGGTPLISREHAALALTSLLDMMASGSKIPQRWVFPHVAMDGPFMERLRRKADRAGLDFAVAAAYQRPVLRRDAHDFSSHVATVVGKKRAKDIERNLRRLEQEGVVAFERVKDAEAVAARVEDFLRIEASGWKGQRGTAFLSRPRDASFARRAYGGMPEAAGLASVDSLLLDGEPIAVSINISTGRTLFTPKCAFDERYRKFGPGMMLEYKVIEAFFAEDAHREMDAATTVDGHVISGLWGQTKPMGTLVIGPKGFVTQWIASGIDAAISVKNWLKRVLRRG